MYFEPDVLNTKRSKCKLALYISPVSSSLSITEDTSHILQNTELHFFVHKKHQVTPFQGTRPGKQILMRVVPCSRSLVPGIPPQWSRLDTRPVHTRFVANEVALGQNFISVLRSSLSSLPPYYTPVFIYMLLLQGGQTSKAWEPSERKALSEIGKHWTEKYCHLSQILMPISRIKLKLNPHRGGHEIMFPSHKLSFAARF